MGAQNATYIPVYQKDNDVNQIGKSILENIPWLNK